MIITILLLIFQSVCSHPLFAQPFLDDEGPDVNPAIYFNRVEGFRPQIGIQRDIGERGMIYGKGGYGFSRKKWVYDAGFARWAFEWNRLTFGSGFHEIVDTNDRWIMDDEEAFVLDFMTGISARDYFLRSGYEVFIRQQIGRRHTIDIRFATDDYDHLTNGTDWSLFHRKREKRENWERETDVDKQRRIMKERMNFLTASYRLQIGEKEREARTYSSWGDITLAAERAGGELGGDEDYNRFLLDAVFLKMAGRDGAFSIKLFSGFSNQPLPLQKRFEFGGIGTLPGYRYKEFGGDRAFLVQVEYLFGSERFKLVPFVGSGAAWDNDRRFNAEMVKYNAGMGIEVSEGEDKVRLRIDVARPVGKGEREGWEKHIRFIGSW